MKIKNEVKKVKTLRNLMKKIHTYMILSVKPLHNKFFYLAKLS